MFANRIRNWQPARPKTAAQPAPAPMNLGPVGFVVVPVFLMSSPDSWQMQLYRAAYERARQTAAVPRHHRRFFSVWN